VSAELLSVSLKSAINGLPQSTPYVKPAEPRGDAPHRFFLDGIRQKAQGRVGSQASFVPSPPLAALSLPVVLSPLDPAGFEL